MEAPGKHNTPPVINIDESAGSIHPSWRVFIKFCRELGHGEIERLSIQDGIPVLAETTKKKVKFT
jgi:hypothetical protein